MITCYYLIKYIINKRTVKEREKTVCVFKMSKSNVTFTKVSGIILTNKKVIEYNEGEELEVEEEYKELICIGNNNNSWMYSNDLNEENAKGHFERNKTRKINKRY